MAGWGGWGGWGGGGGGGTGGSSSGNPLITDALMRSRDGTVLQQTLVAQFTSHHDDVGDTASLKRWEPLLRFNVALFDLLSGLHVESGNNEATLKADGVTLLTMKRPNPAFFAEQLKLVASYAEIRQDRASEIVVQMQPQVPFWSSVVHMHPSHSAKTLEMVELALGFASIVCMKFKQVMAVPRPIDLSTEIQPIVATPSHSAYPSGHSTEAHMIAYVLPYLISATPANQTKYGTQLEAQAERIAQNRTVAGLHFPVDSHAGQILARVLADYFLHFCGLTNPVNQRTVNPTDKHADFVPAQHLADSKPVTVTLLPADPTKTVIGWLAAQTKAEWA